ncbi:hypothetical protein CBP34_12645 [Acidovorax carolinensis]|uniref:Uncharacterized protein n=1 Tax=Acidovorax carolinensis TaxID=553814 RepID=A0A240U3C6_9BURK|nr:hypothetical protein CBP34_12645 [Acidovorax carolinensis]
MPVFAENFNPLAALAAARCPRCHAVGLVEIDGEAHDKAPEADKHQAKFHVNPGLYAQCPACGLVGEWPGMSDH